MSAADGSRLDCKDAREQLVELALGELAEPAGLRAHLSSCGACSAQYAELENTLVALAPATEDAPLPPGLWDRVEARTHGGPPEEDPEIHASILDPGATEAALAEADALPWLRTPLEGFDIKVLRQDLESRRWTVLGRLRAGASFPAHTHGGREHLVLVEGDLAFEDRVLRAGDHVSHPPGTHHGTARTVEGCTVLVEGAMADWMPG